MKVLISWLKELVDLRVSIEELIKLLPLRTIGLKEVTDSSIELDMKGYNRADLLSLRGVAREVATITDSQIKFTEETLKTDNLPQTPVEVENENLSPVYCLAKIEGLEVQPSSSLWTKKLTDSGIRSINNVADITNLAMLEFGQPMHAFDADKVNGKVGVRIAKAGEKITTLDGKIRNLTEQDLLITDEQGPIGLAGVMGGKDSEVSDSTSTILLEAAIFDPINLRKTSQRLGLPSEASKRFQHGLTKTNLLQALASSIKMYKNLGGKLTAITLIGNLTDEPRTIRVTQQKVNSLIGVEISPEQIENSLQKLGFKTASHIGGNVNWEVTVPYWRLDVNIEEDVIEEIARMYGYEKIPSSPLAGKIPNIEENPIFGLIERLKSTLLSSGLTEVQTYSYYSTQVLNATNQNSDQLIRVANPISAETEYLRENNWPNLVDVVGKNIRQGYKDIAIFEIGKIYYRNEQEEAAEKFSLSIALMNGTDNPLAELYEIFKKFNEELKLGIEVSYLGGRTEATPGVFHPNRFIKLADGFMAEVHKRITDKFGINQRVAVMEIGLTKLL